MMPFISIIIPARNEAKFIGLCLESLTALSYPRDKLEIIVVDNGSDDETVAICRAYTSQVYIAPNLTVAGLRNFGAKKAIGDVYAFIDADCMADTHWLSHAVAALEQEECITGSKYSIPTDATWIEQIWFSQKPAGRADVTYINSGNMIIPSKIFNQIGGFDESLQTGEDYELCLRARKITKIISDDRVKVTHLGNPKTLYSFLRREIWHGLGGLDSLHHRWIDLPLFGAIAFLVLSVLQVSGFVSMLFIGNWHILAYSTLGIGLLLSSTAAYRTKHLRHPNELLKLMVLYYIYYLGRSVALFYIVRRKPYLRTK